MRNLLTVQCVKQSNGNVNVYKDGKLYAWFDRYNSAKPTYRNKYVMLNCHRWCIDWVN